MGEQWLLKQFCLNHPVEKAYEIYITSRSPQAATWPRGSCPEWGSALTSLGLHTGQVGATTTCSQNKHVGEFLYFKLPKLPVQVKSRSIKDVTKYVRDENAKENADLLMTLEINEKSGTQEIKCQHSYNLTLRTIGNEFMILLCGIFHPPNSFSLHRLKLTRKF